MDNIEVCRVLVKASCVVAESQLSDTEKIRIEDTLMALRNAITEDGILEKADIVEGLIDVAKVTAADGKVNIEFNKSKLINCLGNHVAKYISPNKQFSLGITD